MRQKYKVQVIKEREVEITYLQEDYFNNSRLDNKICDFCLEKIGKLRPVGLVMVTNQGGCRMCYSCLQIAKSENIEIAKVRI